VKKIYSGFAGAGTGTHYQKRKTEIESAIEGLLAKT